MLTTRLLRSLQERCCWPRKRFTSLGDSSVKQGEVLVHIDNGCSVLGVAHLDSVLRTRPQLVRGRRDERYICCPQLDDRLGVWVLLDLLPALGVECDVLLTDAEERGRSTAARFSPPRDYNWVFEFDRRGTDVVMYDYECAEYVGLVEEYGFSVGFGSFSDICSLDFLGVAGFNFGVGYHGEHTPGCYAYLSDTVSQAKAFASFWNDLRDHRLEDKGDFWGRRDEEDLWCPRRPVSNDEWLAELAEQYGYANIHGFDEDYRLL